MIEIFELNIIKRAFLVICLSAPIVPLFGIFLLLRRYAFFADTLAHVGLLAMALSLLLNINSLVALIILSILISVSVEKLRSYGKLPAEGSLSFFLYAGVALSVLLLSLSSKTSSVMGILFGSLSTVTVDDLYLIAAGTVFCAFFLIKYYRQMLNLCIDEELAHASGINIPALKLIFAVAVALSISVSIKTMGALLIGSLMIIPPLSAMYVTKSLKATAVLSVIYALIAGFFGILFSFYTNVPLGAAISAILIGIFVISFSVGLISKSK